MDRKTPDVKESIVELMENLGTIGVFMLRESRAFLRKSWGSGKEEFMEAVDHTARTMKQSGKMAAEDIERAAEKIKHSWPLLNQEKDLEWDNFLKELTARLKTMGDITRETFDLCVNQAKEILDKQWTALGRLGEGQLNVVQEQTELMAKSFKNQWSVFRETMEKTGKKIDLAVEAAWDELKKKD
ncbi:MAG: hypothetical protein RDU20_08120 [Desulfomonilaceae bacterium]|nr:hypothetical protein [Desulfomonilaceae bacterium]